MQLPSLATATFSFSLSTLLCQRMSGQPSSTHLITRCNADTAASLNPYGICSCLPVTYSSTLNSPPLSQAPGAQLCQGYEEEDRTSVCVEDLRGRTKKNAVCGIEFRTIESGSDFDAGVGVDSSSKANSKVEDDSHIDGEDDDESFQRCPVSYERLDNPTSDEVICQDSGSIHSVRRFVHRDNLSPRFTDLCNDRI